MNEIDESCLEMNEKIYRLSGEFWNQAYCGLLEKQKLYESNPDISVRQAVCELRKELKDLSKEKKLKCTAFSHNEHFYVSLIPYPIYIGIEREMGDFSISAPHICTRHFIHMKMQQKTCRLWKLRPYMEWSITKKLQDFVQNTRLKFRAGLNWQLKSWIHRKCRLRKEGDIFLLL